MAVDKKLKRFSVLPSTSDVYGISLVDAPAVESDFIALSSQKQPMNFKVQDNERRILYGCALRADFDIYRCYGEEEFYISFSKDAIQRLMVKFMKNYSQKNWTKDHMEFAEGLTVVESWIVEDVDTDKAKVLGLTDFSEGSWMIGVKVDDDEIWKSVKEGRWSGFSVEAFCDFEEITREIKQNKHIQMAKTKKTKLDEILDSIKDILTDVVEDVEAGENTAEVVEEAAEEIVEQVEDNTENVEAAEETPAEEPEQVAEEAIETVEENAETNEEAAEDLQAVVDSLRAEIDTLKAENEELKKKNQKMSKQPSTKVVKAKSEKKTGISGAFEAFKAMGVVTY